MEVFKPIKVENYQFMKNGLNQYEPVLVYFKEGKVYFVKNKFDDKLEEWMEENLKVEGRSRVIVDKYRCFYSRFRGLYNRFRKTN